jgi:hypothetical protein
MAEAALIAARDARFSAGPATRRGIKVPDH